MFTLYYSPYGTEGWRRFQTSSAYWISSEGRAMTDRFATFELAEKTVLEWFEKPGKHYPVMICQDDVLPVLAIYHDPEEWPFRWGYDDLLHSVRGAQPPLVPACDFCEDGTPGPYDFATKFGPWAHGCEDHWRLYAAKPTLGVGTGQLWITQDQAAA